VDEGDGGVEPPKLWRPTGGQVALSLGALAVAAGLIAFVLPRAAGTDWTQALDVLARLRPLDILLITALWAAGLWLYTFVYTGSMPGISHSKALALNLTGSLVSNLLPFGGAAGVANTYALTFSWGFSGVATSLMVLVSGLANLVMRLVLVLVGLLALQLTSTNLSAAGGRITGGTVVATAVVTVVVVGMLFSSRFAAAVGSMGDAALRALLRLLRRPERNVSFRESAVEMQRKAMPLLKRGWPAVAFGMLAYYATETLFFGIALHALGAQISWLEVVAAFALSRVLTSATVTPSGVGISEVGTAAALVLFGTPPAVAAAGVLILGFYTYLIEIPAGFAGWVWVASMRRWRVRGGRPGNEESATGGAAGV
jgi:uncharacterized membrane protein YbhN (UPF0104 family)